MNQTKLIIIRCAKPGERFISYVWHMSELRHLFPEMLVFHNRKQLYFLILRVAGVIRWDENAGLRRDAVRSQVIDVLEAQEIKETGNEEG